MIASGTETIEPTVTTAEEAAELDVPVHTPAFLFERVTRDEGGRPLEYVRSVYRGDRYRLELDLRPPTTDRPRRAPRLGARPSIRADGGDSARPIPEM